MIVRRSHLGRPDNVRVDPQRDGRVSVPDDYPTTMDVAGARRYLEVCAATGDPQPFGAYKIRLRADGAAIGGVGFHGAPDERNTVTIGYGLAALAQGNGYATEALRRRIGTGRRGREAEVPRDRMAHLTTTRMARLDAGRTRRPAVAACYRTST